MLRKWCSKVRSRSSECFIHSCFSFAKTVFIARFWVKRGRNATVFYAYHFMIWRDCVTATCISLHAMSCERQGIVYHSLNGVSAAALEVHGNWDIVTHHTDKYVCRLRPGLSANDGVLLIFTNNESLWNRDLIWIIVELGLIYDDIWWYPGVDISCRLKLCCVIK